MKSSRRGVTKNTEHLHGAEVVVVVPRALLVRRGGALRAAARRRAGRLRSRASGLGSRARRAGSGSGSGARSRGRAAALAGVGVGVGAGELAGGLKAAQVDGLVGEVVGAHFAEGEQLLARHAVHAGGRAGQRAAVRRDQVRRAHVQVRAAEDLYPLFHRVVRRLVRRHTDRHHVRHDVRRCRHRLQRAQRFL